MRLAHHVVVAMVAGCLGSWLECIVKRIKTDLQWELALQQLFEHISCGGKDTCERWRRAT